MALQHGGQCRVVCRYVGVSRFSLTLSVIFIVLFTVSAAAEASSSHSSSRKEIQSEKRAEDSQAGFEREENWILEAHLKNWVFRRVEGIFKMLSSQDYGIQAAQDHSWPELKLGVRTVYAVILSALAAAASSAAGLGGGAFFVPLLTLVQFDPKTAAAVSSFMILGGASVGVALNLMRDHPYELNKPLVDFDIALLMQPNMLLGISIGVIINRMLPNWLITSLLIIVLTYTTVYTARTGSKRWHNETRLANQKKNAKKGSLRRANTATEKALTESLLGFYRSISSRYPVKTILGLVFVWLALFALQILRGAHGNKGLVNVRECGLVYWILTASQIPVAFGATAWVIFHLQQVVEETNEPGTSESQDHAYVLGPKESSYFSGMALFAGLVGGILGVGGSLILSPLLLSAGVLPQVTAATTLFMVFFSSSMSVAQYSLMGRIPVGYALSAALICAVFSAVGILGLQKVVRKFGRSSLIVFCAAFVIGLSAILMAIFGYLNVWNQFKAGAHMGFSYPC